MRFVSQVCNSGGSGVLLAVLQTAAIYTSGWIDEFRVSKGIARWTSSFTPQLHPYTKNSTTVSLLQGKGVDAATVFADESGKAWTAFGNAQIDTAQYVFSDWSSLKLDGTGDAITTPDHTDFDLGSGDFTIDLCVRFNTDPQLTNPALVASEGGAPNSGYYIYVGFNALIFVYSTNGTNSANLSASWTPSTATWYLVAVVRSGSSLYFFVNGASIGTGSIGTTTIYNSTAAFEAGATLGASFNALNGWIDELRVTKGLARWTADFTVPDGPYNGQPIALDGTLTSSGTESHVYIQAVALAGTLSFWSDLATKTVKEYTKVLNILSVDVRE